MVSMIVAMAENGVIGRNNKLPWHLPEDLRFFKQTTMGKPIVMGRKTFESIGRPLPGRVNIVVSNQADLILPDGVHLVHSAEQAIELAENIALIDGSDELMVIGGEQIYSMFMDFATRLYLTRVHAEVEGDAYFKLFVADQWQQLDLQAHQASENNPYAYSFYTYSRVADK